jgi:hypothetical protein
MAVDNPYAGLSERSCCDACVPDKCVISGDAFCASPVLGLQPKHAMNLEVINRRKEALLTLELAKTKHKIAQR